MAATALLQPGRWIDLHVESLNSSGGVEAAQSNVGLRTIIEGRQRNMLYSAHSRLAVAFAGLKSNARSEEGQGLIEYALIISLIAIVAIVALQATGTSISSILNKVSTDV